MVRPKKASMKSTIEATTAAQQSLATDDTSSRQSKFIAIPFFVPFFHFSVSKTNAHLPGLQHEAVASVNLLLRVGVHEVRASRRSFNARHRGVVPLFHAHPRPNLKRTGGERSMGHIGRKTDRVGNQIVLQSSHDPKSP